MHIPLPPRSSTTVDRRVSIAFLNWGHGLDHFVMLIFPTVVIGLELVYGRSYSELIVLATASYVAFGVFSLPAGWLADHWSRRNMMAVFYFGCGAALIAAACASTPALLAAALFALGTFAAIYHPVGMAMLIELSKARGRTLALNGVCGNLGAALAAGITAALAEWFGWRAAFLFPATLCIGTGAIYLWLVADDRQHISRRTSAPEVALPRATALAMLMLFIIVALAAGLTFHIMSVSLPKIVDERLGKDVPLVAVGSLATGVFLCGALAQLAVGRLVERIAPHVLFAVVSVLTFVGVLWAAYAAGIWLILALALTMAAIYGQVTVNDMVIARYTADGWRGRVYAVRYFLIFISSGAAVVGIAYLHGHGGFALVLGATAVIALLFAIATIAIAMLVSNVERTRAEALAAAE
jgi:MFS family permease